MQGKNGDSRNQPPTDLLLCVPPANYEQVMPELGPAQIESYLEGKGATVTQLDLNQLFLRQYCDQKDGRHVPKAQFASSVPSNPTRSDELIELAGKPDAFTDAFLERSLFERWSGPAPRVLGVSLLNATQLLPSMRLGVLARRHWGDIPIVWGGPYALSARALLRRLLSDDRVVFDAFSHFGGERALEEILFTADGDARGGFRKAPGLVYRSAAGVVENGRPELLPVGALGAPCFDDLPLADYAAALLPVPTIQGCYHNRCKFCHHRLLAPRRDEMPGQAVAEHMLHLSARYGVQSFFLADHATRPSTMQEIGETLQRAGGGLHYSAMARADAGFTADRCEAIARGGGRLLFVGLESTAPQFLQEMDKGISVEAVERLCVTGTRAGLKIVLFVLDLPSRPAQDVVDTLEWCLARSEIIHAVVLQRFRLSMDILALTDPADLGIEPIADPTEWADAYDLPYRVLSPRSAEDEKALALRVNALGRTFNQRRRVPSASMWADCALPEP